MDPEEIGSGSPDIITNSGLTPEQLAEVPDIMGGTDDGTPASAAPAAPTTTPGTQAPIQATAPAPAQPNVPVASGVRGQLAALGVDVSGYADDNAALAALARQSQEAAYARYVAEAARRDSYYTQLGQRIAPHAGAFEQFLQARVAPKPEAPKPWQPPEFNEQWLNLVERDQQTGAFRALPGVNPEVADKVQKYADWQANFQRNPMALIQQAVEDQATQIAQRIFNQQSQQIAQQQAVRGIIDSNASWIYQTDAQGRRFVDHAGAPIPTPEGARYISHVRTLDQAGVKDPRVQDQLARQLMASELAQARQTQAPATPPAQARAAVGHPTVNPGQAVPPTRQAAVPGATQPDGTGMSLAEQLRQAMHAEGVTDADFNLT